MRRRDIIAAGTAVALTAAASSALASEEKAAEGDPTMNLAGLGLPVIVDGRLRNYVFVTVRLTLGHGQTTQTMQPKAMFFRDAIVRTAHRAPFTIPGNLMLLNENAINAAVMAIANVVSGPGSVTKSEVLIQTPRRRTGMQSA